MKCSKCPSLGVCRWCGKTAATNRQRVVKKRKKNDRIEIDYKLLRRCYSDEEIDEAARLFNGEEV